MGATKTGLGYTKPGKKPVTAPAKTSGADDENDDQEMSAKQGHMPLLDAVQTLVEKERELMQLRVAEASHEAKAWRDRYATLAASTAHLADLTAGDDVVRGKGSKGTAGGAGASQAALAATWPHWELLRAASGEPGVAAALAGLRHVDLAHQGLGEDCLEFLARRLPALPALPSLSLAHNRIGDGVPTARGLGRLLTRPLRTLDLGFNDLGPVALVSLCTGLGKHSCHGLQRLCLDGNWALASTFG